MNIKWKRLFLSLVTAIALSLVAATAMTTTFKSTTQIAQAAPGPTVPLGHSGYITYTQKFECVGDPYCDFEIYIDEVWQTYKHPENPKIPVNGHPLLVGKTQVAGQPPVYKSEDICPNDAASASFWWNGDRSKTQYLSNYWHFDGSNNDPKWIFNAPQPELITARFGVIQVEGGDLQGGESAVRQQATARCISPLWDNTHTWIRPAPADATMNGSSSSTSSCPQFAGVNTSPTSDGGCLFSSPDGQTKTGQVPQGWWAWFGSPAARHNSGETITTSAATFYRN